MPAEFQEGALKLTHGHPLALALFVDVLSQAGPDTAPEPRTSPKRPTCWRHW